MKQFLERDGVRMIVFIFAISILIGQFIYNFLQDIEQTKQTESLKRAILSIEERIKTLVSEGKITKEDAQRLFKIGDRDER